MLLEKNYINNNLMDCEIKEIKQYFREKSGVEDD